MEELARIIITLNELQNVWWKKISDFLNILWNSFVTGYEDSIKFFNTCILNWDIKWLKSVYDDSAISVAIDRCNAIIDKSNSLWIKITTYADKNYPIRFKRLDDYPLIIYSKGPIEELNERKNVAIIWTREPTREWEKVSEWLWNTFSEAWFNIVSWLAKWCDTNAHRWALLSRNWITTAILWNWLDSIYPSENKNLSDEILSSWWILLSEYPVWMAYTKWTLVARDRLQAWLSDMVIWVQFWIKSWTIHAIEKAINLSIPAYAVKYSNENSLWDKISWNLEYLRTWKLKELTSNNVNEIISNS